MSKALEPNKKYMTVQDVAKILGVSPGAVRDMINNGNLNACKLGHRTVRISQKHLDDFLKESERP